MITYRYFSERILAEAPQAMPGNAPFEEVSFSKITDISQTYIDLEYNLIKKNFIEVKQDKLDLYVSKSHPYYVLGKTYLDNKENNKYRFAVIFDLSFTEKKLISNQKQLHNKNTLVINTVHTAEEFRGNKIATKVYLELIKKSQVISDKLQYQGAVKLWQDFIEMKEITVYIYDMHQDKIISKATKMTDIKHIWSTDEKKQKIRLVAQVS